ncbi:hypothetical protein SGFS_013400 [Streptomyces graminofaciens]|uniref:Uncharacterized protein n=2 Tax=Streptomyces graminofaciens TaxID=68212 RepID=A0ABN5VA91_9ACTN|nr:hypothetical protein [Streptomyces graminofaciens]BBC30046.1 hypothetical protein SGFS_013400 [Streptomyces graminofaciens]
MTDQHEPGTYYWSADTDHCPHKPIPEQGTDAWDQWMCNHQPYDDGILCLSAPAGSACLACSAEEGDMVPWEACRVREHARPKHGIVPSIDTAHEPVTVLVGTFECLDRECDEYFDDDGREDPGIERCSHIREEQVCSCQRQDNGEYSSEPCRAAAAV